MSEYTTLEEGTPRFQGRVFKTKKGYKYEVILTVIGLDEGSAFKSKTAFSNKKEAIEECRKTALSMAKFAEESITGQKSCGTFLDLKANTFKKYDDEGVK